MIAEFGHFALLLAFAVAVFQAVVPMLGVVRRAPAAMATAAPAALAQFAMLGVAFMALVALYVRSDFSVANVWENSHSAKPLIYRIAGVWGNHEGSMLLWVLMLAGFGAAVALYSRRLADDFRAAVLATQGIIGAAFVGFVAFTSNPFLRLLPAPADGQGLNPILQDPALAVHPPFLYAGYVGFSMAFSFAVAALITGRLDAAWARWVRPWTLLAWVFLTIGITLGSYWAYYELGWGGWWFWDPVENASFMPWLSGTALLHSAIVMEKRGAMKTWTVLLAILTFALSLIGTFLVRSGVLTSVHSFAVDPARGVVVLAIMGVLVGGALALYAWRSPKLAGGGVFAPISREAALLLNNVLLVSACGVVLVGTLYPLALEALTGEKISVGPPYFNAVFVPLMLPLLVALPLGSMLAWKRGDLAASAQRLGLAAGLALAAGVGALVLSGAPAPLSALGIALGVWLVVGAASDLGSRLLRGGWAGFSARLTGTPRAAFGVALGHLGVGVLVIGVTAMSAWRQESVGALAVGETLQVGGQSVSLKGISERQGPNYTELVAVFTHPGGTVESSKRNYVAPRSQTSEAGIVGQGASELYVVLGDVQPDRRFAVRAYFNPLARLIWLGALIMAFGGLISLSDRRIRIGLPRPSASRTPLPVTVAAE